jgi:hypothetical protein
MKNLMLSLSVILSILILPSAGLGDYAIHLKNGGRFLTPKYWEKDREIIFYIAGGIMGIEKRGVLKIEKIEGLLHRDAFVDAFILSAPSAKPPPETAEKKEDAAAPEKEVDIQAYKNQKKQLMTELDDFTEKLREATLRKDEAAKERYKEEMRKVSGQIYGVTDDVTKKNKGKLPDGWWE